MYIFPLKNGHDEAVKYIFPSKQKDVQSAIDAVRRFPAVRQLIVFGSAVTPNCGIGSDVDLAIDMPSASEDDFMKVYRALRKSLSGEADIIHYNTVRNELLKKEIAEKGVCVYRGNRG